MPKFLHDDDHDDAKAIALPMFFFPKTAELKITGKKVCRDRVSNPQHLGHESDKLPAGLPGWQSRYKKHIKTGNTLSS